MGVVAAAALAFLTFVLATERRADEQASIEARLVSQAQLIAELIASNAALESAASLDDEAPAPFGCGGLVRRGVSARAGTRARRS